MASETYSHSLRQLKVDFIAFMEQVHRALGFDANLISVLFSLLMEERYLTQEEIMDLSGLSRASVSENLAKLTDPASKFPVLVTRLPGDRRKHYYCPLEFDEYIRIFFVEASAASDFGTKFIPPILERLETLDPDDPAVDYLKSFLRYLLRVTEFYDKFIAKSEKNLKLFFENIDQKLDLPTPEIVSGRVITGEVIARRKQVGGDSLLKIKRDFIVGMLESSSPIGRRKEPVAVFLAMGLSHEPMTQEEIMEVTRYGRSTVSETLTRLTGLGVVTVEKKPRDRKKYYSALMDFQNYGLQKSQRQKGGYSQIVDMIGKRFLPRLREAEGDPEEKERTKAFLEANIRAYQLIVDYVTLLFDTFQVWMKDVQWSPRK